MKLGLALPTVDLRTGRPASLAELARRAEAAEAMGYDSVWVMDHYWTEREGGRRGAHEPMLTLAYIAAHTKRVMLGTLVICNSFRDAGQLGREALALADASGGRFVLGLGAGWHQPEYDAFGVPFERKVSRLAETLEVLPRLLAGERVSHEGRFLKLNEAELVGAGEPPPIWLAAVGDRMLELTAAHAQGWNVAWLGEDPARFSRSLAKLHAALDRAGRPRSEVEASVGVFVCPDPEADSRGGAVIAGEPAAVAERLRAYEEAGAEHVIVSLSAAPFTELDPSYPERMAPVLELLR